MQIRPTLPVQLGLMTSSRQSPQRSTQFRMQNIGKVLDLASSEANGETPAQIAAHPYPFLYSDCDLWLGLYVGASRVWSQVCRFVQRGNTVEAEFSTKLRGGQTSVIILNKDAASDVEVELDFGRSMAGVVESETLQAPALDSREAHITTSTKIGSLKQGKHSVIISRATGLRLTVV